MYELVDTDCIIIEFNCLNSSGFYDCDTLKIVNAVNKYMNKHT